MLAPRLEVAPSLLGERNLDHAAVFGVALLDEQPPFDQGGGRRRASFCTTAILAVAAVAVIFVFVRDVKKVPVVSGGRLVGALSRRNVIDYLMGELEKIPREAGGSPRP